MSSKKIWAASLAAVIAGSSFAVVATAADTVDPGASGEVTSNGIKVNVQDGGTYVEKVETDGTTLKITPKKTAYTVKDANKTTLKVKLSGIKEGYQMVKGDLSGKVNDKLEAELEIKDYDLKETAGKAGKTYTVTLQGADVDDVEVKFTVQNVGSFEEKEFSVKGKSDCVVKVDLNKTSDADVVVVYDPAKVKGASAYDEIELAITGTCIMNGDTYKLNKTAKASDALLKPNENGYATGVELVFTNVKDTTDAVEYTKTVSLHYVTEEEYADIPEDESKPADESSDTSTEESKPTVSTSEVKVEVGEDGVLEGADLTKAVFVDTLANKTWNDVKTVTFKSEVPFSLGFAVKAGAVKDKADATWYQKGVDELAKEDLPESAFATEWTLTEEEVAAMIAGSETDTIKLTTKDGKAATITANVTVKETAPNTGIALAIAPAALATAFVTVAAVMSKKKKG